MTKLRAHTPADHQRQRREERRHGRHHDRSEAQQARLVNRLARRLAFLALGIEREVDHHDRVLFHNADKEHDADDGDHTEILTENYQCQQRSDAGRGKRGENRDRMDEALVEYPEHDVHGNDSGKDEPKLVAKRTAERRRRALKLDLRARGQADSGLRFLDCVHRVAERSSRGEIEGDGCRGELADVVDHQRRSVLGDARNGRQRDLHRRLRAHARRARR